MNMDFRTRLREQIEYIGLLDKEVAERAGITKHAMDTYVGSRACMPAADIAVRLAKVLGVSVEWLVDGKQARPSDPNTQNDIDPDTHSLIRYFSSLSPHDKKVLLTLAKTMYDTERNSVKK